MYAVDSTNLYKHAVPLSSRSPEHFVHNVFEFVRWPEKKITQGFSDTRFNIFMGTSMSIMTSVSTQTKHSPNENFVPPNIRGSDCTAVNRVDLLRCKCKAITPPLSKLIHQGWVCSSPRLMPPSFDIFHACCACAPITSIHLEKYIRVSSVFYSDFHNTFSFLLLRSYVSLTSHFIKLSFKDCVF